MRKYGYVIEMKRKVSDQVNKYKMHMCFLLQPIQGDGRLSAYPDLNRLAYSTMLATYLLNMVKNVKAVRK